VHDSDKGYNLTDNYVDLLQNKPIVCYSDGATSVDISKLEKCQIKVFPLDILKKNAAKFFKRLAADGILTVDAFNELAGFDPHREAAISLLEKFLPLDIELQLGDVLNCRKQANLLIEEGTKNSIAELLNRIYEINAAQPIQNVQPEAKVALKLKERLMSVAEGVATQEALSMDVFFGYQVDESGSVNRHDPSNLREEGFHRTFEKLRDMLLGDKY
jgi:hypothetical protein